MSGKVYVNRRQVRIQNPQDAMKHGIAMVSEDRARTGLLLPFSIKQNMTFAILKKICRGGFINTKKEKELVG